VKLSLDHGCLRGLSWRLEPASDGALERLRPALAGGWVDRTVMASVWHFEAREGAHQLVIVPSTGRLQLRVHYTVPRAARRSTARELARRLAEALGEGEVETDSEDALLAAELLGAQGDVVDPELDGD